MTSSSSLAAFRLLLAHDLRVGWRDFRSHFRLLSDRAMLLLVLGLAVVMHGAAWQTGSELAAIGFADAAGRTRVVLDLAPGIAFVVLLMLAQALGGLTRTLYGRGDLDLILSSPLPLRAVFAVRVLAVALGTAASAAIFVVPVAVVALLHGAWRGLALLPMLAGTAMLTSAVGLAVVMALLAALGPRRTRLAAQIAATFVGGGFMLWLQVHRYLPSPTVPDAAVPGAAVLEALWLLPTRAAAGDGPSLLAWVGTGAVAFAAAILGLSGRFAKGIAAASGLPAPVVAVTRAAGHDRPFRAGLARTLRQKEWRLVRRDPWLVSQLLLQVLYMTPMLLMLRNATGGGGSVALAVAPMLVVVCYQLSASMTWLGLSAEDAPELLATAPVDVSSLQAGKLAAVAQLCAGVAVLPLGWLFWLSPGAALRTAAMAAVAVMAAMLLALWHTRSAPRSGFAARHRESKLLAVLEMVMSMVMGVAAALAVAGSLWVGVPLGLAVLILLVNRPSRRSLAQASAVPLRAPA